MSQAKQESACELIEQKKESQDPKNQMKTRTSELGYAPFQEDERDPDFVMGQEEFVHRSLCEDMINQNLPETEANKNPESSADEKKWISTSLFSCIVIILKSLYLNCH